MKKILLAVALVVAVPSPALADHGRGGRLDGDCYEQDCGDQTYDQWRNEDQNRNRNRNRGAFSPGPFDRSPIDIHDNDLCISPDCSGRGSGRKEGRQPPDGNKPSSSPGCLIFFPYHCDRHPHPKGLS